jgi:hypothetical protein
MQLRITYALPPFQELFQFQTLCGPISERNSMLTHSNELEESFIRNILRRCQSSAFYRAQNRQRATYSARNKLQ